MVSKRKITALIIALYLILTGYTYPSGSPYIDITSSAGNLRIYFPTNQGNYLIYDETQDLIINTSSSTLYGYTSYNGNDYRVNFPSYDVPYISITYQQNVSITNVQIIDNYRYSFYTEFSSDMTTYIGIIIMLLLFFIMFKR